MKKLLLGVALVGAFVSTSFADGENAANNVTSKGKLKVEIGGHIHRALGMVDAGDRYYKDANATLTTNYKVDGRAFAHVDNINSQSRFHVKAKAALNEWLTAGTYLQLGLSPNKSSTYKWLKELTGNTTWKAAGSSDASNAGFSFRQANVFFAFPWATLTLGLANSASEDTAEQGLSGTYAADAGFLESNFKTVRYAAKNVGGGGNAATATRQTDLTVGNTFDNMDGLGRANLIKVESAPFYGFKVAASHISGNSYDASIAYDREFEALRLKGKVAYARKKNNLKSAVASGDAVGYRQWSGSLAVLFPFGLNAKVAAGTRNYENNGYHLNAAAATDPNANRTDGRYWELGLGWQLGLIEAGKTCLNVKYAQSRNNGPLNVHAGTLYAGHTNTTNNAAVLNTDTTRAGVDAWSVTALQRLDNIGTEVYLNVRHFNLRGLSPTTVDNTAITTNVAHYKSVLGIMAGARIKF